MIKNKFAILTLFLASSSYATPPPEQYTSLRLKFTCLAFEADTQLKDTINIISQFKLAGKSAVHTIYSKKDDHIILTETLSNEEECSKYPTLIKWTKNLGENYKSTFCLLKVDYTPDNTRGLIRKNSSTTPVIVSLEAPKEISEESTIFNSFDAITSCQNKSYGKPLVFGEQLISSGFKSVPRPWEDVK